MYTMSRLNNHPISRGMPIVRGQREAKLGDNEAKQELQLHHGKVFA